VDAAVEDRVRAQIEDQVGAQVEDRVGASVEDRVRAEVTYRVAAHVRGRVGREVWDQAVLQLGAPHGLPVVAGLCDQVVAGLRDRVGARVRSLIGRACYGSHDASRLAFFAAFRAQLGCCLAPLEGLWGLARSTGWWWPFRRAVIVTPRPCELHMVSGRLHRDGGPALAYPDGFALWRLHGVEVPDWLAALPADAIDPHRLLAIVNGEVRREFLRKVGIERALRVLEARVISSRGPYELLEINLGDSRRRPYLKMQNPSVDAVHIEGVDPRCRTVQEALNYRNGLAPEMIDDVGGADWYQQGDVILRPRGATRFKSRPKILT
jgi:hypothetical protein